MDGAGTLYYPNQSVAYQGNILEKNAIKYLIGEWKEDKF